MPAKQFQLFQRLIAKGRAAYGAEYSRQLSNHLPMCLYALARLGANDAAIARFYHDYTGRLRPREPARGALTAGELDEVLGKRERNEDLFQFFRRELQVRGRKEVLGHYLDKFMPSVASAAFHPLIRLAFALELNDDDEIAESFAAWAMSYATLPAGIEVADKPYSACVDGMKAISIDRSAIAARTIFERAFNVMAHPTFKANLCVPDNLSIPKLAQTALRIYLAKPSFAHLHLITSCHALRIVASHSPVAEPRLGHYWLALWAVYVSEGGSDLADLTVQPPAELTWPELAARACASRDDHTNKFVYSCQQEAAVYGRSANLYLLAANLKVSGSSL